MLNPGYVKVLKLRVSFTNGNPARSFECHFWTIGTSDLDLYKVNEGRLEQFAAIGSIDSVEEQ
jgi:hypothetical protein